MSTELKFISSHQNNHKIKQFSRPVAKRPLICHWLVSQTPKDVTEAMLWLTTFFIRGQELCIYFNSELPHISEVRFVETNIKLITVYKT